MRDIAQSFSDEVFGKDLGLEIGGQSRSGEGEKLPLINPSDGRTLGELSGASAAQVDEAVAAARSAFKESQWATDAALRVATLRKLADLVEENAEVIAYLDAWEAGKVLALSVAEDVPDVVANLRFFIDLIEHDDGRYLRDTSGWGWVQKVPLGVVCAVLPWNFPIAMLGWKVAPALATGNAMVIKPSKDSSLSALYFARLAREAGVPDGIVNVIVGDGPGTGAALGRHGDIDMVTFTGSGEVGRLFLQYSAESNLKRVSLELGGRAIYAVDAAHVSDLAAAAEDIAGAAFGNAGQNCTASSRAVYVGPADERYEEFTKALADAAAGFTVGDPLADGTAMGPVINLEARDRISSWVEEAVCAGAEVVHRQEDVPGDGFWIGPTVLRDVPAETTLGTGEIFGPLTVLIRVDTREEAVALVNDEDYGLASTVWCEDVNGVRWWADRLRVGTLAFNGYSEGTVATPFGGFRQSGFWGRDNGPEAMAGYQEAMTVWVSDS